MPDEERFYSVYSYGDHLSHGDKLKIEHSLSFSPQKADLSPLVGKTVEQLEAMRSASIDAEREIFKRLCASVSEWEAQGAQTLLSQKALEYVKTPTVTHTSNQWKDSGHDQHECSNMVYKMYYQIYEDTTYDRKLKKSVPVAWRVRWYVGFNPPPRRNPYSYYTNSSTEIAGQENKRYTDKAAADKYIQGRITAYAHLFTELSPPIPEDKVFLFQVNGHLLPGYTAAPHEPTPEELLDFLDEEDIPSAEAKVIPMSKKPAKKVAPKKSGPSR